MITIQTGRTTRLPCGVNHIKGVTTHCCDFLFLDCSGCKLIKWSKCTQAVETIELDRKYLCICFDHKENCYWGIPVCEPHLIYRLDACFCVVGHITISGALQQRAASICCDDCANGIWVCYPCQLALIEKCSEKVTWYKNEDVQKINLGVLTQCACRVDGYFEGSRQIIEVQSPYCQESIEICVPKEHRFVGLAPCFCEHKGDCCFCVLLSNGCSHEFILAEYCVCFSQKPMELCCPCHPAPSPCPPPRPPKPNCSGSYEVMHSIALEEAGLAHILNAEGEKIQKAVAISDNIEQLICVNESVKRTLTQVTLLEGMLYSKLEALVSCDSFCCHTKPPFPPTPCCDCGGCHQPTNSF